LCSGIIFEIIPSQTSDSSTIKYIAIPSFGALLSKETAMEVSAFAAALLTLSAKKDGALITRAGPAVWLYERALAFTETPQCAKETRVIKRVSGIDTCIKFTGTGSFEFFCNEYMEARAVCELDQHAIQWATLIHKAMADPGSPTLYLFACACRAGLLPVLASLIHYAQNERKKRKEPSPTEEATKAQVAEKHMIEWFDELGAHANSIAFGWALDAKAPPSETSKKEGKTNAFLGLESRNDIDWQQITLAEAFLWLTAEYDQFEAFRLLLSANTFKRNISVYVVDVAASRLADGIRRRALDICFDGKRGGPRINIDGQRVAYELGRFQWMPVEQQVMHGIEKQRVVEQFVKVTSEFDSTVTTEIVDEFIMPPPKPGESFMYLDEYDAVQEKVIPTPKPRAGVAPPQPKPLAPTPPQQAEVEPTTMTPTPVSTEERQFSSQRVQALRVNQGYDANDEDADLDDKRARPYASNDAVLAAYDNAALSDSVSDGRQTTAAATEEPTDSELMPPPAPREVGVEEAAIPLPENTDDVDLSEFQ
jgi:hypothetical protein